MSLRHATWGSYDNATVIDHNVEDTLRELKAKNGKNMVIRGRRS